MFFPERIQQIKPTDRVLEIGPGSTPHPRADVLLEKIFHDPAEKREQRGNTPEIRTQKPITYYEGDTFPFDDKAFDYVICSHVLEHVEDPEQFVSELFRIAPRGYLEYPTIYYEYLYNFSVHRNVLKYDGTTLFYLKKAETPLDAFRPVQSLFLEALDKGYSSLVDDLKPFMFEGFEWERRFPLERASSIERLSTADVVLPVYGTGKPSLLKKIRNRLLAGMR